MRASLVDVSRYQGSVDVGRLKAAGFAGLVNRCTIGLSTDGAVAGLGLQLYEANRANCRDLGMIFGAYHVLWPSNQNPTGEADWFLSKCGDIDLVVLDVELTGGLSKSAVQDQAKVWLDRVAAQTNVRVVVYTGSWWWNIVAGWEDDYPLWEAEYTVSLPRGGIQREQQPEDGAPAFVGWADWKMWQWTSGGDPHGAESQSMDFNVYNGTEYELRTWLGLDDTQPGDPSEPIEWLGQAREHLAQADTLITDAVLELEQ